MPSSTYRLFAQAIEKRQLIACSYGGHSREICPIILGHTKTVEKALVYQTGGRTSQGSVREGEWKCFELSKVSGAHPCSGAWQAGTSHQQRQTCVEEVDYDVNPTSPYNPTHSLGRLPKSTF
jgi:hypothetical protein